MLLSKLKDVPLLKPRDALAFDLRDMSRILNEDIAGVTDLELRKALRKRINHHVEKESIEVKFMEAELIRILEKMYKKRLLSKGIRQIEDYERMNLKIREYNNYECIVPLSKVLVDETRCASATEEVVETIAILVENHKRLAIHEVLKASSDIAKNGKSWLNMLYRMMFLKQENVQIFKEEYHGFDEEVKNNVADFLKYQLENNYISLEIFEEILGTR